nr:MAG TPA: hypothetical protein [Caudoviricetes sp.]
MLPWFKDGISMIAERMRAASKKKPPGGGEGFL